MSIDILSPEQWSKVFEFLRSQSDLYVGREAECKRFIGAVFWITRTGAQWRMLPAEYGRWNFTNGSPDGVNAVYGSECISISSMVPDMENLIIDSTVVRAHHSAAGAPKKTVGKHHKPLVEAEVGSLQRST